MQIDRINLNNLRVFECVYKTRCMTTASKELHLTQSGVSQHIKALEETLGVKLFDRIHKTLLPTAEGERLYAKTGPALGEIEEAVRGVTRKEGEIRGLVRIGLPIEFGNNLVIPKLAELGRAYPGVTYKVVLEFASHINDLLVAGKLDFAFVDDFSLDKRIEVEPVAHEVFELCAAGAYLNGRGEPENCKGFFESLDYVDYQEGEPVLRSWFSHHLKRKNLDLKVRAHVMDVQGVARFVLNGLGVGILPDHLVKKLKSSGEDVYVFSGSGRPLTNTIQLAWLKNRTFTRAADRVWRDLKHAFAAPAVSPS